MSKEMLSSPKFEHVQRNAVDIKYTPWLIEEMGKKIDILRGAYALTTVLSPTFTWFLNKVKPVVIDIECTHI